MVNSMERLVLTPRNTETATDYIVSGDIYPFVGNPAAMSLVVKATQGPSCREQKACHGGGGQRRDRTADAGLFRAALYH